MWTAKGKEWPTRRASSETAMLCLGLENNPVAMTLLEGQAV